MRKAHSPARLEAWKKAADESVGLIFFTVPVHGPRLSGELKEHAMDSLHHLTFLEAYGDLPEAERGDAYLSDRAAMEECASRLIDAAVSDW